MNNYSEMKMRKEQRKQAVERKYVHGNVDYRSEYYRFINEERRKLKQKALGLALCRRMKVEKLEGDLQGVLDDVRSLPNNIKESLASISRAGNSVADLTEHVQSSLQNLQMSVADSLSTLTQILSTLMPGAEDGITIMTLVKLLKTFLSVAIARPGYRTMAFLMEVTVNFPGKCVEAVKMAFNYAYERLRKLVGRDQDIREAPRADGDEVVEVVDGHREGIADFIPELPITALFPAMGAGMAAILAISFGLPTGNMDKCVEYFGKRCNALKNIASYMSNVTPLFESAFEWLHIQFVGPLRDGGLDAMLAGYATWAESIVEFSEMRDGMSVTDRILKTKEGFYTAQQLHATGVKLHKVFNDKRLNPSTYTQFMKFLALSETWKKLSDRTSAFAPNARVPPAIVHISGGSGVGKSGLIWCLASDFKNAAGLECPVQDSLYTRSVEQDFWDGYSGQLTCVYDDFMQTSDSIQKPNAELMELIRIGNVAAYPLHMADLEDKARTRFDSQFVVLTSNVEMHSANIKSLASAIALQRRIDMAVRVTIKPEFAKVINKPNGDVETMLDGTKVSENTPIYEPYQLQEISPVTGEIIGDVMNYNDFVVKFLARARSVHRHGGRFVERVNALAGDQDRKNMVAGAYQGEDDECFSDAVSGTLIERREEEASQAIKQRDNDATESESLINSIRDNVVSSKRWFLQSVERFATLKNLMILTGMVLSAVGAWKLLFSGNKSKERVRNESPVDCSRFDESTPVRSSMFVAEEGNPSGDFRTLRMQKVNTEGNPSGDSKTVRSVRVAVEGNPSGDSKTLRQPAVIVESNYVSGDARTTKAKKVNVEGYVSGDNKTLRVPKVAPEGIRGKILTADEILGNLHACEDPGANALITYRLAPNLYKIYRVRGGVESPLMNGLFVRDTIMLVPKHLLSYLMADDALKIVQMNGKEHTIPLKDLKFSPILHREVAKDAILIQFPRKVESHSDLVKHFVDSVELRDNFFNVCALTYRRVQNDALAYLLLGCAKANSVDVDINVTNRSTGNPEVAKLRKGLEYSLQTQSGDCGAPVVMNRRSAARKITGIHVAGSMCGTRAFAESITQKNLKDALANFDSRFVIITDNDQLENGIFTQHVGVMEVGNTYLREDYQALTGVPCDLFTPIGECSEPQFHPSKTNIFPSAISGACQEPLTAPSVLYSREIDVMALNLQKSAMNTPYIDPELIEDAVHGVKHKLFDKSVVNTDHLKRVLSFEEAISGSGADSAFLEPVNRSSSAGFPWNLFKVPGTAGKQCWLGDDDTYLYDAEVREVVEQRVELARQGIRMATVWTDTLKDERRPLEKVRACKTRTFAVGPMDYLIAFRMYFLGFNAHVMENRIVNEQSIGTNVHGNDWRRTALKLQKHGEHVIAGDFSSFDGTLNASIMWEFVNVINEWYDDGEENARIRRVLFLDVINSTHVCSNVYYTLDHSQPSGNPITTILNSFYNSVSMRIVYALCRREVDSFLAFDDYVSMVSYGDDNVLNISPEVLSWFNQNTITEKYKVIGMTYTDETKTDGAIAPARKLHEVAYLKRRFEHSEGYWFCPLSIDVVLEMPNWVRGKDQQQQTNILNCKTAIEELAYYSREIYDTNAKKLGDACLDVYGSCLEYPAYREARSKRARESLES